MSKRETMLTPFGEMKDMISCLAIYEGLAKPKKGRKKWKYDEAIALR